MMKSPKNIKNEMLSPTDKTILCVSPSLFSFKMWRISSPGITVKKVNPKTCLRTGILRNIERSVKMRNIKMNKRDLLVLEVLSNSLMLIPCRKFA